MCLNEASKVNDLKYDKNGNIVLWKVYDIEYECDCSNKILISPYQRVYVRRAGVIKSSRKSKKWNAFEESDKEVHKGIHVYLGNYGGNKEYRGGTGYTWIPVTCNKRDFVGKGEFDYKKSAVFTKVRITDHTWRKYVRGTR